MKFSIDLMLYFSQTNMATAAYKALKKQYNFIFYMTVSTCKSFLIK